MSRTVDQVQASLAQCQAPYTWTGVGVAALAGRPATSVPATGVPSRRSRLARADRMRMSPPVRFSQHGLQIRASMPARPLPPPVPGSLDTTVGPGAGSRGHEFERTAAADLRHRWAARPAGRL